MSSFFYRTLLKAVEDIYKNHTFESPLPIVYVWGSEGCGKSFRIEEYLRSISVKFEHIYCIEYFNMSSFYQDICYLCYKLIGKVWSGAKSKKTFDSAHLNDTFIELSTEVFENDKNEGVKVLFVDGLCDLDISLVYEILPILNSLPSILPWLSVIISSNVPFNSYFSKIFYSSVLSIYMSPYSEKEVCQHLNSIFESKSIMKPALSHSFHHYLVKILYPITMNISSITETVRKVYTALNISNLKEENFNLNKLCRKSAILLQNMGISPKCESMVEGSPNSSFMLDYDKTMKYLLISSYLASCINEKMDSLYFAKITQKRSKSSKRASKKKISTLLDNKKRWFSLERWLVINHHISSQKVIDFRLYQHISLICHMKMVKRDSNFCKYMSNLDPDLIFQLSKSAEFPINYFLNNT